MNRLINLLAQANQYQVRVDPLPHTAATPAKVQAFLTIVFAVIGAVSLLMFTIGGFRYVISQGDPQATAKAKNTLIYAIVGLVVSIISVAIVTLILRSV